MPRQSAGLVMYRRLAGQLQFFMVHPGGPLFAGKEKGAWGLPKGELTGEEDALAAAKREFAEETGFEPQGPFYSLGTITQAGGKRVTAWAFAGDCDPALLKSNLCTLEWPPRSKRFIDIPEVDRGAWFTLAQAEELVRATQLPLLHTLCALLGALDEEILL